MTEKTVEKVGKVAEQVEAAAEKEEKPSAEIQPDTGQASSPPPQNVMNTWKKTRIKSHSHFPSL